MLNSDFLKQFKTGEELNDSIKYYRDIRNSFETAREEGRKEGIEEGIKKIKRKIALTMNAKRQITY